MQEDESHDYSCSVTLENFLYKSSRDFRVNIILLQKTGEKLNEYVLLLIQ